MLIDVPAPTSSHLKLPTMPRQCLSRRKTEGISMFCSLLPLQQPLFRQALPNPNIIPEIIPGPAARNNTVSISCHFVAPRERNCSLSPIGRILSDSTVNDNNRKNHCRKHKRCSKTHMPVVLTPNKGPITSRVKGTRYKKCADQRRPMVLLPTHQ